MRTGYSSMSLVNVRSKSIMTKFFLIVLILLIVSDTGFFAPRRFSRDNSRWFPRESASDELKGRKVKNMEDLSEKASQIAPNVEKQELRSGGKVSISSKEQQTYTVNHVPTTKTNEQPLYISLTTKPNTSITKDAYTILQGGGKIELSTLPTLVKSLQTTENLSRGQSTLQKTTPSLTTSPSLGFSIGSSEVTDESQQLERFQLTSGAFSTPAQLQLTTQGTNEQPPTPEEATTKTLTFEVPTTYRNDQMSTTSLPIAVESSTTYAQNQETGYEKDAVLLSPSLTSSGKDLHTTTHGTTLQILLSSIPPISQLNLHNANQSQYTVEHPGRQTELQENSPTIPLTKTTDASTYEITQITTGIPTHEAPADEKNSKSTSEDPPLPISSKPIETSTLTALHMESQSSTAKGHVTPYQANYVTETPTTQRTSMKANETNAMSILTYDEEKLSSVTSKVETKVMDSSAAASSEVSVLSEGISTQATVRHTKTSNSTTSESPSRVIDGHMTPSETNYVTEAPATQHTSSFALANENEANVVSNPSYGKNLNSGTATITTTGNSTAMPSQDSGLQVEISTQATVLLVEYLNTTMSQIELPSEPDEHVTRYEAKYVTDGSTTQGSVMEVDRPKVASNHSNREINLSTESVKVETIGKDNSATLPPIYVGPLKEVPTQATVPRVVTANTDNKELELNHEVEFQASIASPVNNLVIELSTNSEDSSKAENVNEVTRNNAITSNTPCAVANVESSNVPEMDDKDTCTTSGGNIEKSTALTQQVSAPTEPINTESTTDTPTSYVTASEHSISATHTATSPPKLENKDVSRYSEETTGPTRVSTLFRTEVFEEHFVTPMLQRFENSLFVTPSEGLSSFITSSSSASMIRDENTSKLVDTTVRIDSDFAKPRPVDFSKSGNEEITTTPASFEHSDDDVTLCTSTLGLDKDATKHNDRTTSPLPYRTVSSEEEASELALSSTFATSEDNFITTTPFVHESASPQPQAVGEYFDKAADEKSKSLNEDLSRSEISGNAGENSEIRTDAVLENYKEKVSSVTVEKLTVTEASLPTETSSVENPNSFIIADSNFTENLTLSERQDVTTESNLPSSTRPEKAANYSGDDTNETGSYTSVTSAPDGSRSAEVNTEAPNLVMQEEPAIQSSDVNVEMSDTLRNNSKITTQTAIFTDIVERELDARVTELYPQSNLEDNSETDPSSLLDMTKGIRNLCETSGITDTTINPSVSLRDEVESTTVDFKATSDDYNTGSNVTNVDVVSNNYNKSSCLENAALSEPVTIQPLPGSPTEQSSPIEEPVAVTESSFSSFNNTNPNDVQSIETLQTPVSADGYTSKFDTTTVIEIPNSDNSLFGAVSDIPVTTSYDASSQTTKSEDANIFKGSASPKLPLSINDENTDPITTVRSDESVTQLAEIPNFENISNETDFVTEIPTSSNTMESNAMETAPTLAPVLEQDEVPSLGPSEQSVTPPDISTVTESSDSALPEVTLPVENEHINHTSSEHSGKSVAQPLELSTVDPFNETDFGTKRQTLPTSSVSDPVENPATLIPILEYDHLTTSFTDESATSPDIPPFAESFDNIPQETLSDSSVNLPDGFDTTLLHSKQENFTEIPRNETNSDGIPSANQFSSVGFSNETDLVTETHTFAKSSELDPVETPTRLASVLEAENLTALSDQSATPSILPLADSFDNPLQETTSSSSLPLTHADNNTSLELKPVAFEEISETKNFIVNPTPVPDIPSAAESFTEMEIQTTTSLPLTFADGYTSAESKAVVDEETSKSAQNISTVQLAMETGSPQSVNQATLQSTEMQHFIPPEAGSTLNSPGSVLVTETTAEETAPPAIPDLSATPPNNFNSESATVDSSLESSVTTVNYDSSTVGYILDNDSVVDSPTNDASASENEEQHDEINSSILEPSTLLPSVPDIVERFGDPLPESTTDSTTVALNASLGGSTAVPDADDKEVLQSPGKVTNTLLMDEESRDSTVEPPTTQDPEDDSNITALPSTSNAEPKKPASASAVKLNTDRTESIKDKNLLASDSQKINTKPMSKGKFPILSDDLADSPKTSDLDGTEEKLKNTLSSVNRYSVTKIPSKALHDIKDTGYKHGTQKNPKHVKKVAKASTIKTSVTLPSSSQVTGTKVVGSKSVSGTVGSVSNQNGSEYGKKPNRAVQDPGNVASAVNEVGTEAASKTSSVDTGSAEGNSEERSEEKNSEGGVEKSAEENKEGDSKDNSEEKKSEGSVEKSAEENKGNSKENSEEKNSEGGVEKGAEENKGDSKENSEENVEANEEKKSEENDVDLAEPDDGHVNTTLTCNVDTPTNVINTTEIIEETSSESTSKSSVTLMASLDDNETEQELEGTDLSKSTSQSIPVSLSNGEETWDSVQGSILVQASELQIHNTAPPSQLNIVVKKPVVTRTDKPSSVARITGKFPTSTSSKIFTTSAPKNWTPTKTTVSSLENTDSSNDELSPETPQDSGYHTILLKLPKQSWQDDGALHIPALILKPERKIVKSGNLKRPKQHSSVVAPISTHKDIQRERDPHRLGRLPMKDGEAIKAVQRAEQYEDQSTDKATSSSDFSRAGQTGDGSEKSDEEVQYEAALTNKLNPSDEEDLEENEAGDSIPSNETHENESWEESKEEEKVTRFALTYPPETLHSSNTERTYSEEQVERPPAGSLVTVSSTKSQSEEDDATSVSEEESSIADQGAPITEANTEQTYTLYKSETSADSADDTVSSESPPGGSSLTSDNDTSESSAKYLASSKVYYTSPSSFKTSGRHSSRSSSSETHTYERVHYATNVPSDTLDAGFNPLSDGDINQAPSFSENGAEEHIFIAVSSESHSYSGEPQKNTAEPSSYEEHMDENIPGSSSGSIEPSPRCLNCNVESVSNQDTLSAIKALLDAKLTSVVYVPVKPSLPHAASPAASGVLHPSVGTTALPTPTFISSFDPTSSSNISTATQTLGNASRTLSSWPATTTLVSNSALFLGEEVYHPTGPPTLIISTTLATKNFE